MFSSALLDVDAGNTTTEDGPTANLQMRHIEFDADLRTPDGWTRGDLCPTEKSTDPDNTKAGVDVHCKRLIDWEVERKLKGLFWGPCGLHVDLNSCVTTAVPTQGAPDTATDFKYKGLRSPCAAIWLRRWHTPFSRGVTMHWVYVVKIQCVKHKVHLLIPAQQMLPRSLSLSNYSLKRSQSLNPSSLRHVHQLPWKPFPT